MAIERRYARCRSCLAEIIWTISAAGKRQPIDRDPVAGGSIRIVWNPLPNSRVEPEIGLFDVDDDALRYTPHHQTCPHAAEWHAATHPKP